MNGYSRISAPHRVANSGDFATRRGLGEGEGLSSRVDWWMDGWVRSVVPAASPVGKLWQGGDGDREVGISKKGRKALALLPQGQLGCGN